MCRLVVSILCCWKPLNPDKHCSYRILVAENLFLALDRDNRTVPEEKKERREKLHITVKLARGKTSGIEARPAS